VFPFDIGLGVNWQTQSGWPYARLINVALPNAGTQTIFMENISRNRSDTVSQVNLRVDKGFTFSDHRLTFLVDVYNALNVNPVYNFNLVNGSQFNRIIAALDPRTVQLGLRFEF
jgi:outer membrane receptor protein involved in Fe transport